MYPGKEFVKAEKTRVDRKLKNLRISTGINRKKRWQTKIALNVIKSRS
jgi:hypothetical protein